jgi:hypothetical protein
MYKIDKGAVRYPPEKGMILSYGKGVPAHMGHFESGVREPHDPARDQPQPFQIPAFSATFLGLLQQHLVPQADPEQRFARLHVFGQPGKERLDILHGIIESSDSRQHDTIRSRQVGGLSGNRHGGTRTLQAFADAAEVPETVVNDYDLLHG